MEPLAASDTEARPRLGRMLLMAALALLALRVLQIVLALPGGVGAEDFLGLGAAQRGTMDAIGAAWKQLPLVEWGPFGAPLTLAALLYFALDTVFFVPLYGVLLLEIAQRLGARDADGAHRWSRRAALAIGAATLLLMAVDVVENSSGIARLGLPGPAAWFWGLLLPALAAPLAARWVWRHATDGEAVLARLRGLGGFWSRLPSLRRGLTVASLLLSAAVLAAASPAGPHGLVPMLGEAAHAAKLALAALLALVFVALGLVWLFRGDGQRAERAVLRRGLADIVWRTRYVLVALVLLIALTLAMDQCRDVAIGVAYGLFRWPQALWAWPVLALSVVAVWAMSFSCWLWARLVCRMPGPATDAAAPPPAVEATLHVAARGLARLLGLVPAFAAALMSAHAARDAIWAGMRLPAQHVAAPLVLLAFGLASVLGGLLFLRGREHAARDGGRIAADYYDDPGLRGDWMAAVAAEKYAFAWRGGPGPLALPLIALVLAVALRCAAVLLQPGVPLAYPVVVLTLVGWLGLFGWLAMKEQREARPWVLLIVAAVGMAGLAGLSDNHRVRVATVETSAALPGLPAQVIGALLLVACIVVAARLMLGGGENGARTVPRWSRVLAGLFGAGLLVLIGVDRFSAPAEPRDAPVARRAIDAAFARWTDTMWADATLRQAGTRVFFVASEGGGIRAAYWTARTLAALQQRLPAFAPRSFMLSGVSGGALGEAVYSACLETPAPGLDDCVARFGDADLLTPLLGAWLFEDALARLLPTSLPGAERGHCLQPGCGFLSRGLWFEQALEQAVPALAQGIAAAARGQAHAPQLFLNATWVESGDRAIAAGVHADWRAGFATARDQLSVAAGRGAPVDLPLSAAAHNAARFPFVNAIGLLRATGDEAGHLADGGYFDNSGTQTVADALAAFRVFVAGQRCEADATDCAARLDWLRRLKPTVIVIKNGLTLDCGQLAEPARLACLRDSWGLPSSAESMPPYQPERPVDTARLSLYVDAIGPLATVVNAAGTGANGRRAEALLRRACGDDDCTVRLAQHTDGVLYPLGWYLSPTARIALDAKARREVEAALERLR